MRTTVTLEPEVALLVRRAMRERDVTFKQAINDALRAGLRGPAPSKPFRTKTYNMGVRPGINLDKALQLAGELENEAILAAMRRAEE